MWELAALTVGWVTGLLVAVAQRRSLPPGSLLGWAALPPTIVGVGLIMVKLQMAVTSLGAPVLAELGLLAGAGFSTRRVQDAFMALRHVASPKTGRPTGAMPRSAVLCLAGGLVGLAACALLTMTQL